MDPPGEKAVDAVALRRDATIVAGGFWRKLRRVARRLPFAGDLLAAYYCAVDPLTPRYVKAVLMGAIAYFVIPTDLIPDFVAGFGFTDDAAALLAAMRAVAGEIRPRHRDLAARALAGVEPAAASRTAPPAA